MAAWYWRANDPLKAIAAEQKAKKVTQLPIWPRFSRGWKNTGNIGVRTAVCAKEELVHAEIILYILNQNYRHMQ